MVTKVEEVNNIRPGMGKPDLVLVLEDSNPRDSKFSKSFKLGGLEVSSKQSIQFPTHVSALACLPFFFVPNIPEQSLTGGQKQSICL